ncbi:hypothetical protein [Actinoplanes sp. NPDC049681]|uniref:hypothetical protein n=1 Tax=Actinoplanes sp. NPDC049681 TaxID=3363905 RepID=UPI00379F59DF
MSAQERQLGPERWTVKCAKFFLAVLVVFLIITSLLSGFLRGLSHWQTWELVTRIGAGVMALLLTVALFVMRRGRLAEEESTGGTPDPPSPEWLDELWTEAARRITRDPQNAFAPGADAREFEYLAPVTTFVELIMSSAKHRVRVAETVDLEGHLMVQRVTVEFDLPRGWEQAKVLYLPVLHPTKGELVDNFHLRDAGDNSLADLTYEETTRLAAAGLRLLMAFGYQTALAARGTSVEEADEWPNDQSRASEKELLAQLAMRGRVQLGEAKHTVNQLLGPLDVDDLTRDRLNRYVLELCGAYPIVAVVDPATVTGGRVLIKYERTLMPSSVTALDDPDTAERRAGRKAHRAKHWRGLARIGLGLRPSQVAIPVILALTASSYHLRLNAPDSKYVFEQRLMCRYCRRLVDSSWTGKEPQPELPAPHNECSHGPENRSPASPSDGRHYFRMQRRRGQNFVHLYLRGFGSMRPQMEGLQIIARFKEVPPGSRLQSAVTALATTVLVIVVGYLVSNHRVSPGSDYPAVVLALPAVVASWFGIASERNALVGGSLLARVSLIVSGILSIASIVTYLTTASAAPAVAPGPRVSLLGVTHTAWIALSILSLVNFMYIYYRFILKLVHYRDLMRRTTEIGRRPSPVRKEG